MIKADLWKEFEKAYEKGKEKLQDGYVPVLMVCLPATQRGDEVDIDPTGSTSVVVWPGHVPKEMYLGLLRKAAKPYETGSVLSEEV